MCDSAFILFLHAVLAGHLGPQEGQDPGGDIAFSLGRSSLGHREPLADSP